MSFKYNPYLPESVKEFVNYKSTVKNASELSMEGYKYDLYLFFRFLAVKYFNVKIEYDDNQRELPVDLTKIFSNKNKENIENISLSDIIDFLSDCRDNRSNDNNARARKAVAIRQYFKFICDYKHLIENNPASMLEVASPKKRAPKYLTLQQCYDLLNSVEGKYKERDYCIIMIFLNCGLRLAELVSLNISSINFHEKKMFVTGKGDKERLIYLNDATLNAIRSYLRVRPHDGIEVKDKDALFISHLNKRMGKQAVQLMVKKYFEKIGLDLTQYSVHKLRHTAATLLYQESGVDLIVLKDMLGHENLGTTEIYTHVSNEQLRDAMNSNPLNTNSSET